MPFLGRLCARPRPLGVVVIILGTLIALSVTSTAEAGALESDDCTLLALAADDPLPVGTGRCPGVRPGALHWTVEGQCTFNFLFKGSDGHRYIGSAGHCVLTEHGEEVWSEGQGSPVLDRDQRPVGEVAYAVYQPAASGYDFALVRLRKKIKAKPAMCWFGGPSGINDDLTGDPVALHYFGHGGFIGWEPHTDANTLPGRSAIALDGMPDPEFVRATGAAFFGDSGSGVISADGRAVGVAVTLLFGKNTLGITRLGPQLERAEDMLDTELKLRVADFD